MNMKTITGLVASLLLMLAPACSEKTTTPAESINALVDQNQEFELDPEKALNKDSEDQLGDPWEEEETVVTTGGEFNVTTTYVQMRENYSALLHPEEFVLYNVNSSVLWPGNLIQGSSILSGALNPVPITGTDRTALTIFISIVTGTGGDYSETVEAPTGSKVFEAMNRIVADHFGSTPGQASLEISKVHNMNHVMFNLNAGGSTLTTDISGTLGFNWEEQRERVMVKFVQQYYSMAYDTPQDAEAVFADTVTVDDLAPFTSEINPVSYIDSVTFGRLFVYVYESLDSETNLEASLNVAYNGIGDGTVEAETAYQNVVNNSTVKVYSLGGNAQDALAVASDFSALRDYLINGAILSADSPGAPISYNMRYLKNANLVKLNNTLEFYVDTVVPVGNPVEEPTESTVNIHLDQFRIIDEYDGLTGGDSEGEIDVRIRLNDSGTITDIYDSYTTGSVCVFPNGTMIANATCSIDQSTGQVTIPNVNGNKIIIEAYGHEEDGQLFPFSIAKEFVYTCNGSTCAWMLDNTDPADTVDALHFLAEHNVNEYIEFELLYDITINGVTL